MSMLHDETMRAAFPGFCEDRSGYLAHERAFLRKYRHWRGRSGRCYVFSVYSPDDCPPYENAVVMVVTQGKARACVDLGALPLTALEALRRGAERDAEFQIHVLADRGADRRALIADLTPVA